MLEWWKMQDGCAGGMKDIPTDRDSPLKFSGLSGADLLASRPLMSCSLGAQALARSFSALHGCGARMTPFNDRYWRTFHREILQSWRNCGDYAGYPVSRTTLSSSPNPQVAMQPCNPRSAWPASTNNEQTDHD